MTWVLLKQISWFMRHDILWKVLVVSIMLWDANNNAQFVRNFIFVDNVTTKKRTTHFLVKKSIHYFVCIVTKKQNLILSASTVKLNFVANFVTFVSLCALLENKQNHIFIVINVMSVVKAIKLNSNTVINAKNAFILKISPNINAGRGLNKVRVQFVLDRLLILFMLCHKWIVVT